MVEAKHLQGMAVCTGMNPCGRSGNWQGRKSNAAKVADGTRIMFPETMVNSCSLNESIWMTELLGRRVRSRISRSNARMSDGGLEDQGTGGDFR